MMRLGLITAIGAVAATLFMTTPVSASAVGAVGDIDTNSPEYKRGRLLYIQCRACHDLKPSAVRKVGPNLAGMMNRQAALDPNFSYSAALQAAAQKLRWDEATLDRWLEKPAAVVPGNTMAFAGIANPADRKALITYIKSESRLPQP